MVINMHIYQEENKIIIAEGKSQVWIEAWGANSLRVRMTALPKMDENDWALTEKVEPVKPRIIFETIDVTDPWYQGEEYAKYHQTAEQAQITNGKITAKKKGTATVKATVTLKNGKTKTVKMKITVK